MSNSISPLGLTGVPQIITLPAATTAYTLSQVESGSIISIGALNAPCTITLPPVSSPGCNFTVVVTANLTQALTISAQTLCLRGFGLQPTAVGVAASVTNSIATGVAAGTAQTSVIVSAANSRPGDRLQFQCDGFQWFWQGWAGNAIANAVFTYL